MLRKNELPAEDREAFGVIEYQVSKSMGMEIVEYIPEIVSSVSAEGDHDFTTPDSTLYRLPSGAYVMVTWGFELISEDEAALMIKEVEEHED